MFLIICAERYFINLTCHLFTSKRKETRCNDLHFIKFWKFRKQVQTGDKFNVRGLWSVKGCLIYYKNTILICIANATTILIYLTVPENAGISLGDLENPECHMIFCPEPQNMTFFEFHWNPEIWLFVNKIELIIKYGKSVM